MKSVFEKEFSFLCVLHVHVHVQMYTCMKLVFLFVCAGCLCIIAPMAYSHKDKTHTLPLEAFLIITSFLLYLKCIFGKRANEHTQHIQNI